MKKLIIALFFVAICNVTSFSQSVYGDVNGDGVVTVADVSEIYNIILVNAPTITQYEVNGVTFKMLGLPGGTFTMGATAEQGSDAYNREYPLHEVTLSSFAIGQTEVTQELWMAVMGNNPSTFVESLGYGTDLQRPVESISWNDCQEFITNLNQLTGKTFRLPTEAEWEFAARGGNLSQKYKYSGSNNIDNVAWYGGNTSNVVGHVGYGAHTVATKWPNEVGLYDMSGNVNEWCQDWYGSYTEDAQTNPEGPLSGTERVFRGGCYEGSDGRHCRVSYRSSLPPNYSDSKMGLRLAM